MNVVQVEEPDLSIYLSLFVLHVNHLRKFSALVTQKKCCKLHTTNNIVIEEEALGVDHMEMHLQNHLRAVAQCFYLSSFCFFCNTRGH